MERLNELALFAGAGGGLLGSILNGWRTVCAVEIDDYCRRVLLQRQADGCLEPFPIWDDVTTFDGRPWRGLVDIVTGGFPCQDISAAGKGAGIDGERSGLWSEFARIIGEVRPPFAFVENSPMLTVRGLGRVLGDLAAMGFDAKWGVVSAADAIWAGGTPEVYHERERIWIVANADAAEWLPINSTGRDDTRCERVQGGRQVERSKRERTGASGESQPSNPNGRNGRARRSRRLAGPDSRIPDEARGLDGNADSAGLAQRQGEPSNDGQEQPPIVGTSWWITEPELGRVAHGVANRVDRLRAIGNGQVPAVVRAAWELLSP